VLQLFNIVETRNFTCVAASKLGVIETHTLVKVQGEGQKVLIYKILGLTKAFLKAKISTLLSRLKVRSVLRNRMLFLIRIQLFKSSCSVLVFSYG
jgi:hypothetical protein